MLSFSFDKSRFSGLSLWEFIEFLGQNNVPVVDYREEQLSRELKSVEKLNSLP